MGYSSLVQLLRENIAKNKVLIHKYYLYQDFSLDEKIDLERLLFASVFNISIIPYSNLEKIVDGFSITLEEKKTMKNQLRTIVTILKLNSINGTNMVLDEGQMEVLNIFLRKLHEYISERRDFMLKNNIDIEKLAKEIENYIDVEARLGRIKTPEEAERLIMQIVEFKATTTAGIHLLTEFIDNSSQEFLDSIKNRGMLILSRYLLLEKLFLIDFKYKELIGIMLMQETELFNK